MNNVKRLTTPLTCDKVNALRAGDYVKISGIVYTARDAAHLRLNQALKKGEALPIDLTDQIIYYVGPAPARPGQIIGSAGPTTSYRMDDLTIPLLERGLRGMIGKGLRSDSVKAAVQRYGAVYFAAIGGAGAIIANSIVASRVVCYGDLGPEAVRCLTVKDFPAIVAIDAQGNDLYQSERTKYKHLLKAGK